MSSRPGFAYTPAQLHALQLLSDPQARHVMLFGGSRSGKTFVLCCAMLRRALKARSRHAIIRRYYNGVRSAIGLDTLPKALKLRYPRLRVSYNRSNSVFILPNGSEIWLVGLDDAKRAEKILGREFSTIYFNECSELDYPSVQTALTRLAQNVPGLVNRAFYDCNPPPRSHWCHQLFVAGIDPADRTALAHPEIYSALRINPEDNRANLPDGYIENTLANLPERQRRRFLLGEWGDDTEGALWTQSLIDRTRVVNAPELVRIVVGVDPAVTSGEGSDLSGIVAAGLGSDLSGIVAAGLGEDGDYYVLADRSLKASPSVWGGEVVKLYRELDADRVVGEVNNGGDLIENLLRQIDPDLSYRDVRATRGKILRAEPVVALYEKGRVHHVGRFADLEDQMTGYSPQFSAKSPDRMDALVWAITELMRGGSRLILA